jgi:thiol-disulfide isomerase/thioredoxin
MHPACRIALALLVASSAASQTLHSHTGAPTDPIPDAAQRSFKEGQQFEDRKQLTSAADSYHAALKSAGNKCAPCLQALANVQLKMTDYKGAAATDAQLAASAPDATAKAAAEMNEGLAFYQLSLAETDGQGAIDKNPKHADLSLHKAEATVKQAVADDPTYEPARMAHAHLLAALKQDDAACTEFAACAALSGLNPAESARALRFSKDVAHARGEPAPLFTAKTVDGTPISLDSFAGKVVLVDFWATWCTFCRRDSAYVQSLLDSFDKDHFVLLEVDVDDNETVWKNFVSEERMEGVQMHDEGRYMQDLFHVSGYPTYVIFDGNGIVQSRDVGAKGDLRGTIRKLLETSSTAPVASAGN